MARSRIERIREKIRLREYDMSAHAMEEMAEDNLDIEDIESAILGGRLSKIDKEGMRGTIYTVKGLGLDQVTLVGVVGRFTTTERYLIITVYEITDKE